MGSACSCGCNNGEWDGGCFCNKTSHITKHSADRRYCNADEERSGCCICYTRCKSGYKSVGCCLCEPNDGPPGTVAVWPHQRYYCNNDQVLEGALCYDRCPNGYFASTVNICSPNEGAGIKKSLAQRQYCEGNISELLDGLCYKPCKSGWSAVGTGAPTECKPDGGIGRKVSLEQRQYCGRDEELKAGMCYKIKEVRVADN